DTTAAANHLRAALNADSTNIRALFTLAREVTRHPGTEAYAQPSNVLDRILPLAPENIAAILERMRLAAETDDWETTASLAARLDSMTVDWSPDIRDQIRTLRRDLPMADTESTVASIIRTGNLMKAVDAYRASLAQLQTDILDPALVMTRFVRLPSPSGRPSPPDTLLDFERKPLLRPDTRWWWLGTVFQSAEGPLAAVAVGNGQIHVDPDQVLDYPGPAEARPTSGRPVAFLDFDYDFRMDLAAAGPAGLRFHRQEGDGTYTDRTSQLGLHSRVTEGSYSGIWSLDIDLEGDMDLVVSGRDGPLLLRNNGDGTFTATRIFVDTRSISDLAWADFDDDGDPDAMILSDGSLHFYRNQRSGQFQFDRVATQGAIAAIHVSDFIGDGYFDLLTLGSDGRVATHDLTLGKWSTTLIPVNVAGMAELRPHRSRISTADLDNNGALDLIVSHGRKSSIWLRDIENGFIPPIRIDDLVIFDEADLNADGNLGLVAMDEAGVAHHLVNQSSAGYLSRSILPKAADAVGDRRINSFGIGGEIELRTDLLYQKRLITSPLIHFGLGDRQLVDVARIIWPNGTSQAQFDLASDQALIATQSLKGSCPWVFTFDGTGMRFVTDFLWRSPLGLRINAVETAGIATTEDWVKIDGRELVPRDGIYDVRITAELWET
ncbi:MAG: CRTAC1 family protein, partial [Rhodothermales bacterium]|nr:CRTAC1 family protein [Rhodothermales bacterium]